jgi:hypothetical protein
MIVGFKRFDKKGAALLIFPRSFYSFAGVVKNELARVGYDVVVANDEFPANMIGKILGNLGLFVFLSAITERALRRGYVANKHYSLVLIFKGRGVSKPILEELRNSGARVVAYNFDSFGYNPAPLRWYKDVNKYCTFDYLDSKHYFIPLVELFSSLPADEAPKQIIYQISAILRNHSNRLKYLDVLLTAIRPETCYIYIFELNVFTFVFNVLRSPLLYIKYWSHIHFKPLPYLDYATALRNSNFTVDYAHPRQSGITIRCFEALSAQTKIITNNRFVTRNTSFGAGNTIIFDGRNEPKDVRKQFELLRDIIPSKHDRTISEFMEELLA